jgi:hypothetical protein
MTEMAVGQDHRPDPARMAGREANFDEEILWTEDDILRLHGLLLEKSLHDLFDLRVSAKTQADILDWMRAPTFGVWCFYLPGVLPSVWPR